MDTLSWFQCDLSYYLIPLIYIGGPVLIMVYFYCLYSKLNQLTEQQQLLFQKMDQLSDKLEQDTKNSIKRSDDILTEVKLLHKHVFLAHQRVKDAYTGVFSRLNLNRIRRAYKYNDPVVEQQKQDERNAIMREVCEDMLTTEFS